MILSLLYENRESKGKKNKCSYLRKPNKLSLEIKNKKNLGGPN